MPLLLLVGGARSGKSTLAVEVAAAQPAPVVLVATATAGDADMAARIARHRAERPAAWVTLEEPLELAGALAAAPPDACLVIDCLTLWVANLLLAGEGEEAILPRAREAAALAVARPGRTVAVTNEVGSGVVPGTELGRSFRDALGQVNAAWSAAADDVRLCVAGRTLRLERATDAGLLG